MAMSNLRFKVGDPAIFAFASDASGAEHEGSIVEVFLVGPFVPGDLVNLLGVERAIGTPGDYIIRWPETTAGGIVKDWQLRRLDAGDEPSSLSRSQGCEVTS